MRHLCDVNDFLGMTIEAHRHHQPAREWFDALGEGDTAEFCRMSQNSYLRLLTTRVAENYIPITNHQARQVYRRLLGDSVVRLAAEPPDLEAHWLAWADAPTAATKLWMDAYLAAFAFAAGMQLVTFDGGFEKYRSKGLDLLLLNDRPVAS
jgi:toxin-antitoxin system PIN domain toxin